MNLEPHIIVVLYSKFSSACKNFVSILGTMDIMKSIQFVCVDNRELRKTIVEEGNLKVSYLPCLLKIFDSGDIQLFEGQTAFDVLESYKNLGAKPLNTKISPEQQQSQIQQQTLQSQLRPPQTTPLTSVGEISSLKDDKMAVNTFHYVEPKQNVEDSQTRPIPDSLIKTSETAAAKAQRLQKERESSQMFPPLPGNQNN
jgi:hypothetical protein